MIENVIGTFSLPVGVATNFIIDGQHYIVPFVLEEASVVVQPQYLDLEFRWCLRLVETVSGEDGRECS